MGSSGDKPLVVHSTNFEDLKAEYTMDFSHLVIKPERMVDVVRQKTKIETYRTRYAEVEVMTKVPWYLTGAIHLRESDQNFHAWLHNGDPMYNHNGVPVRTTHEPSGRPHNPHVSWEEGCLDAYREAGLLDISDWSNIARVAWAAERYNGFGPRLYHNILPSYLYGATNLQMPGKYTRDKFYDPTVMDGQVGVMAIFKLILGEGMRA